MLLQAVWFTVAAASCWLTDTACSIQVIWTVQLAGPPPDVGGQLIVAVGLGSRAASDTPHRARSKAASCSVLQTAALPAVPTQTRLGLLTCVWVVIRPTAVITRQRDQAELAVESCSVSVVPAKPAAVVAKPSRLYVIAVTLLSPMKVSGVVPVNAPCTRSTPAALFRS